MRYIGGIITVLLLYVVSLFIVPQSVSAEVVAYKVTDGLYFPADAPCCHGRVLFYKIITHLYTGGRVVLSKNPDGTGRITTGDTIQATGIYPTGGNFIHHSDTRCITFNDTIDPVDITGFFVTGTINNVIVKFSNWCRREKIISPVYVVFLGNSALPQPFLDLPWDYQRKGLSFNEAALAINSFFDHEYPLLSTSLEEDAAAFENLISYKELLRTNKSYSSHDGYDYGRPAKVAFGDNVLAAADGTATYMNSCSACGNAILIDHKNGYQTRYYHLQKDGLISTIPGEEVPVTAGQPIGKNGATGNVIPAGEAGAHIHFMVVHDKNGDGNFQDNIPDGIVDPYGWESSEPDPWDGYSFVYGGATRKGSKSYYLWKKTLSSKTQIIPLKGGSTKNDRFYFDFPAGSFPQSFILNLESAPGVEDSASLRSIGSTVKVDAKDTLFTPFTNFLVPFTLTIDFADIDLLGIQLDTLSIYSSSDGKLWVKEDTTVDLENKKATSQINHLTQFALMGERQDTIAPVTTSELVGTKTAENIYNSDVTLELNSQDNEGGIGVDYTFYRIIGGDWEEYAGPLVFSLGGNYEVEFYAVDNDENIEAVKKVSFALYKSPPKKPEIEVVYDPINLDFSFTATQGQLSIQDLSVTTQRIFVSDNYGNTLTMNIKDRERGTFARFGVVSLQYNDSPPIPFKWNRFLVRYDLNSISLETSKYSQAFELQGLYKIELLYKEKTGMTTVTTNNYGEKWHQKYDQGIQRLKVYTENGTLRYSY